MIEYNRIQIELRQEKHSKPTSSNINPSFIYTSTGTEKSMRVHTFFFHSHTHRFPIHPN